MGNFHMRKANIKQLTQNMRETIPQRTIFQSNIFRRKVVWSNMFIESESDFAVRYFGILSSSCFPKMPPNT